MTGKFGKRHILVGFADAIAAPEACWSLLNADFNVTIFSRANQSVPLLKSKKISSVTIEAPENNITTSILNLNDLIKTGNYDAFMPFDDTALYLCSQLTLVENFCMIAPSLACINFALDKRKQIKEANKVNMNVPRSLIIHTRQDIDKIDFYPAILKPYKAIDSINNKAHKGKTFVCHDHKALQEVKSAWNEKSGLIAQEYISGIGCGLFGMMTSNGLTALSAHERVRMMNPAGSGSSACRSVAVPTALAKKAESMLNNIGYIGIFMLELLKDRFDKYWFMEINGRTWGSLALARHQGAEYPAWLAQYMLKGEYNCPQIIDKQNLVCRHLGRELIHLLMVLRGPKNDQVTQWPSKIMTIKTLLKGSTQDCWYNKNSDNRIFWLIDALNTVKEKIFK